jgi:hypothetical protein
MIPEVARPLAEVISSPARALHLTSGSLALVADPGGAIRAGSWDGLYDRDIRFLSRFELRVDGARPLLLSRASSDPGTAELIHAVAADRAGSPTALLVRRPSLEGGLRDELAVHTLTREPLELAVELDWAADFAGAPRIRREPDHPGPRPLRDGDDLLVVRELTACASGPPVASRTGRPRGLRAAPWHGPLERFDRVRHDRRRPPRATARAVASDRREPPRSRTSAA